MAGVPLLAARAIAQALWQSSGSSRNTQNMTACEGGKRTMSSLQHSGSRWASPGGSIRGKSSGRQRRARPRQRPPGAPGALPAPEAARAWAWAQTAPSSSGERGRAPGASRDRGRRAPPCPGTALRPLLGEPALPGGTGELLLNRYRLLSPLGSFPDRTSR